MSQNETRLSSETRNSWYLLPFSREEIRKKYRYHWFERYSVEQILSSNLWIGRLFRESLSLQPIQNDSFTPTTFYYHDGRSCERRDASCQSGTQFHFDLDNLESVYRLLYVSNYFSSSPWVKVWRSPFRRS